SHSMTTAMVPPSPVTVYISLQDRGCISRGALPGDLTVDKHPGSASLEPECRKKRWWISPRRPCSEGRPVPDLLFGLTPTESRRLPSPSCRQRKLPPSSDPQVFTGQVPPGKLRIVDPADLTLCIDGDLVGFQKILNDSLERLVHDLPR